MLSWEVRELAPTGATVGLKHLSLLQESPRRFIRCLRMSHELHRKKLADIYERPCRALLHRLREPTTDGAEIAE